MSHEDFRRVIESLPLKGKKAVCPAHEDRMPSLTWTYGDDGRLLLHCHAGCDVESIVAALGGEMSDLYPADDAITVTPPSAMPRRHASVGTRSFEAFYVDGSKAGEHRRADDGRGDKRIWWEPAGVEVRRLALYGSWDVGTADPVVVVEGERAVLAVRYAGLSAVGTYGSGHAPQAEALAFLAGRDVVLWPDNDDAGRRHMQAVAAALGGTVRVVTPPEGAPKGWDAADTDAEVVTALVAAARAPDKDEAPSVTAVNDVGLLPPFVTGAFPDYHPAGAFGGVLGECIDALRDGTDASLVGMLGSLIALCGVLVPGRAYFHRWQPSTIYVALVGDTSRGRKGTAMLRAKDSLSMSLQADKVQRHVLTGVNSGEGLISRLDVIQRENAYSPTAAIIFEEEYAGMLASRSREGSTLDPKMREAFDVGSLGNIKASGSIEISLPYWLSALIAITPVELRRRLEAGADQTGAANRWLHLPIQRREVRPRNVLPVLPDHVTARLVKARQLATATKSGLELAVDDAVATRASDYSDFLDENAYGVATNLSARFSIIAFRVAMVHALVDGSGSVTLEHLDRGIALTEYARQGIPWTFGATMGDPYTELLFRHLLEVGVLSQNVITQRIIRDSVRRQNAVDELERLGLAKVRTVVLPNGGRRSELHLQASRASFVPFVQVFDEDGLHERAEDLHGRSDLPSVDHAQKGLLH